MATALRNACDSSAHVANGHGHRRPCAIAEIGARAPYRLGIYGISLGIPDNTSPPGDLSPGLWVAVVD